MRLAFCFNASNSRDKELWPKCCTAWERLRDEPPSKKRKIKPILSSQICWPSLCWSKYVISYQNYKTKRGQGNTIANCYRFAPVNLWYFALSAGRGILPYLLSNFHRICKHPMKMCPPVSLEPGPVAWKADGEYLNENTRDNLDIFLKLLYHISYYQLLPRDGVFLKLVNFQNDCHKVSYIHKVSISILCLMNELESWTFVQTSLGSISSNRTLNLNSRIKLKRG